MVESALVLLVLLAILIGIADFGQILFLHGSLVERARLAARAAAVHNYDDATIVNLVLFGRQTAPPGSTRGFMGLTSSNVAIARSDVTTTARRLVLTISNLSYTRFSPFFAGVGRNIPVRVAVTIETP